MLMGQYDYAIDTKGRLNFPARFRQEMGESFVVTRWLDNCLIAFPQSEFDKMAETLGSRGMTKARDIQRFLFSAAIEVQPDAHGRILLPANLRNHAHLEKDVTIIGCRNHAEIWDTALWNEHEAAMDQADILAAMEELEI